MERIIRVVIDGEMLEFPVDFNDKLSESEMQEIAVEFVMCNIDIEVI